MLQLIVTQMHQDRPPIPCYLEACPARATFTGAIKGARLAHRFATCSTHLERLLPWYGSKLLEAAAQAEPTGTSTDV